MKIEASEFNKEFDKAKEFKKELEDVINGGFEAINKIAEDSALHERKCQDLLKEKDVLLKSLELSLPEDISIPSYDWRRSDKFKEFKELLEDNHKSSGFFSKLGGTAEKKVINSVQFKEFEEFFKKNGDLKNGEDIFRNESNVKKIEKLVDGIVGVVNKYERHISGAALRQVGINYDYVRDRVDKFKVNKTEDRTNTDFWKGWAKGWLESGLRHRATSTHCKESK